MSLNKVLPLIFIILFFSKSGYSQDFNKEYSKEFDRLTLQKDTVRQSFLLKKWEKASPNDPELFTSYFNYYVKKSVRKTVPVNNGMPITYVDTSKNDQPTIEAGVTYEGPADTTKTDDQATATNDKLLNQPEAAKEDPIEFDAKNLQKAYEYINKGIAKYPNRIDMRLSKIYVLSQCRDFDRLTKEIIATLEYSHKNKNAWLETENKQVKDPQSFMLDVMQDFIGVLFETGSQMNNIKSISETALKYYPKHVQSVMNMATVYILTKDYKKGFEYFQKAEKLAPTDCTILSDMAVAYLENNNKEKALDCYSKIMHYGNKAQQENAKAQLMSLQKK